MFSYGDVRKISELSKAQPGPLHYTEPKNLSFILRKLALAGQTDLMQELFQLKPNTKDYINKGCQDYEYTALMLAGAHGHVGCFNLLLDQGARREQVSKSRTSATNEPSGGNTALVIAIVREQKAILKAYCLRFGAPRFYDNAGQSVFVKAVHRGEVKVYETLLAMGLDITAKSLMPLDLIGNKLEISYANTWYDELKYKADKPKTHLIKAYLDEDCLLFETLVRYGALKICGIWEAATLNLLIKDQRLDLLQVCLKYLPHLELKDSWDQTPLIMALASNHQPSVQVLLNAGFSSLDLTDEDTRKYLPQETSAAIPSLQDQDLGDNPNHYSPRNIERHARFAAEMQAKHSKRETAEMQKYVKLMLFLKDHQAKTHKTLSESLDKTLLDADLHSEILAFYHRHYKTAR